VGLVTEPVAEPVIGYRRWRVTNDGRLAPLNYPTKVFVPPNPGQALHDRLPFLQRLASIDQAAWHGEYATARCATKPGLCGNAINCSCGLHAHNDPSSLPAWTPGPTVTGAIVAWGRIIQHQTGFRAEHARPVAFAEPAHGHGCTTTAAAALYGGNIGWACCVMDPSLPVRMGDRYGVPVLPMDELVQYAAWHGDALSPSSSRRHERSD
jgi:hypothetical protein